jgi:hypothetical protein
MSAVCSICKREDRPAIEEQHVQGLSLRAIASQHPGTTAWSLRRHFAHVPAIIEKQQQLQVRQERNDRATAKLPARVEKLIAEAEAITMSARQKRDFSAALAAIRTRLSCLETIGRLTGELRPGGPLGEFVPGTAAAAASVTVNMPAPEREKTWASFEDLMRQIYNLGPKREPRVPGETKPN